MKKILIIIFIALLIPSCFWLFGKYKNNIVRIKLAQKLLTKSLSEVQEEFASMDCKKFTDKEKAQGFEALVTAYCRPEPSEFDNREDFLCAVGLNCSCPNGRVASKDCHSSSLSWSSCVDFNDKEASYCHKTASQVAPEKGQVAADWSCFPKGTNIKIGENKYTVTDKGSAIKGRRFDIWIASCRDTIKKTGIYQVKF